MKAEKGAYFISADIKFSSKSKQKNGILIANVNQTIGAIERISKAITGNEKFIERN